MSEEEREAFVYAFGTAGAVQCGFCIPGMVLAGAALIRRCPDPTSTQIAEAIRGNVCRCTGYKRIIVGIKKAAAVLRGEETIEPSIEAGESYGVGEQIFRTDVRAKVLGTGQYPDDLDEREFPGLTIASAVRSKYPRARVVSIDTEKARALPGVVGVLTAADVPVNQVGHLIQDWDVMIAEGDITRCVGDAIALVVAKDRKTLERAKKLVKVEYEELEPVRNIDEAAAPDAPIIHESFNAFGNHVVLKNNICQQRQLDLVPEVELSSNDLLIDLARIGLGIAFIPDFCLPDDDPDLFKLTMSEVFPSRQLVVGYNDKLPISEAAKYFIESLNEDK